MRYESKLHVLSSPTFLTRGMQKRKKRKKYLLTKHTGEISGGKVKRMDHLQSKGKTERTT